MYPQSRTIPAATPSPLEGEGWGEGAREHPVLTHANMVLLYHGKLTIGGTLEGFKQPIRTSPAAEVHRTKSVTHHLSTVFSQRRSA